MFYLTNPMAVPSGYALLPEVCSYCSGVGRVHVGATNIVGANYIDTAGFMTCPCCGGCGTVKVLRPVEPATDQPTWTIEPELTKCPNER